MKPRVLLLVCLLLLPMQVSLAMADDPWVVTQVGDELRIAYQAGND